MIRSPDSDLVLASPAADRPRGRLVAPAAIIAVFVVAASIGSLLGDQPGLTLFCWAVGVVGSMALARSWWRGGGDRRAAAGLAAWRRRRSDPRPPHKAAP